MSDGMVTRLIVSKVGRRTASDELVAKELRRMRAEEPHLYREVQAGVKAITQGVEESSPIPGQSESSRALLQALVARMYLALRLGHEKLWKASSGLSAASTREESLPSALVGEIRKLLEEGRKIDAIKKVREETGRGLKEAKESVEAIEDEMV